MGFIHPSQFVALSAEAGTPFLPESVDERAESEVSECNPSDTVFWIRDHKLGISTQALLPLYNAAKYAFMAAYQMLNNVCLNKDDVGDETLSSCSASVTYLIESEVMKHSRALLMLSCDFGAAWNSRFLSLYARFMLKPLFLCSFTCFLLLILLLKDSMLPSFSFIYLRS